MDFNYQELLVRIFSQLEMRVEKMPGIEGSHGRDYILQSASGKDIGILTIDRGISIEYYERDFSRELGRASWNIAKKTGLKVRCDYSKTLARLGV